jgi:hypothetical protein
VGQPPRHRPARLLAALFAGNDDQILIGRVGEAAWWRVVADRLHVDGKPAHVDAARSLGITGHLHTGTRETRTRIETFVGA